MSEYYCTFCGVDVGVGGYFCTDCKRKVAKSKMSDKTKMALIYFGITLAFFAMVWYSGAPWFVIGAFFLGRLRQLLED